MGHANLVRSQLTQLSVVHLPAIDRHHTTAPVAPPASHPAENPWQRLVYPVIGAALVALVLAKRMIGRSHIR